MPTIVGTAVIEILADTTAFNASMAGLSAKTSAAMAPAAASANGLSGAMVGVGVGIGKAGASLTTAGKALSGFSIAAVALGAIGIKVAYDFDSSMRRVGAITRATSEEYKQMDAVAQKMGRDTAFTAAEAADGMSKLALAGFSVNEIMKAIPGTIALASAGGFDLATSTGIAADTLRSFGMQVDSLGRVNDVLGMTMTATNTDLMLLAYGL